MATHDKLVGKQTGKKLLQRGATFGSLIVDKTDSSVGSRAESFMVDCKLSGALCKMEARTKGNRAARVGEVSRSDK